MRIVVFTGLANIEASPWWPVLNGMPGLSQILICRKITSRRLRDTLRRLRRNIRKHGLIFIPYRIGVLLLGLPGRLLQRTERLAPVMSIPCDRVEHLDIHGPECLAAVQDWRPDLGVSLGAPILKRSLFAIPRLGTLNLHLGRVPDFRGAPPGFWELYTGASEIGATVHWIDECLDTGRVILNGKAPIYERDTLKSVLARVTELGTLVLEEALQLVGDGQADGEPQVPGGRTYRFPTLRQRARLGRRLAIRQLRLRSCRWLLKQGSAFAILAVGRPLRDLRRSLAGSHPVRVFTFHRVSELSRDGMTVSPGVFRRQVRYILKNHDVVSMEEALALLRRPVRLRKPAAVFTFDDGYRSVHQHAWPTLAEHAAPGCCFVSTDLVGTDRRFPHDRGHPADVHFPVMSWDELAILRRAGWSVGAHSASHRRLADCEGDMLRREIEAPLRELRRRLGVTDVAMAYPFGGPDDITLEGANAVRAAGYTACFANAGGENWPGASPLELRRIDIGGDHPTLVWKLWTHGIDLRQLSGQRDRCRLREERRHVA